MGSLRVQRESAKTNACPAGKRYPVEKPRCTGKGAAMGITGTAEAAMPRVFDELLSTADCLRPQRVASSSELPVNLGVGVRPVGAWQRILLKYPQRGPCCRSRTTVMRAQ